LKQYHRNGLLNKKCRKKAYKFTQIQLINLKQRNK